MSLRLTNLPNLRIWRFAITAAGTAEQLTLKLRVATIAFNNNSATNTADTITDSGNGFLTAGFKAGDNITVSGASNAGNNSSFVIASVVAGTITLTRSNVLTTEVAGATVKIVATLAVSDGVEVTIKAKQANTGNIFLSHSSTGATATKGWILRPNESLALQVSKTDLVYVDAANSADEVECSLETN